METSRGTGETITNVDRIIGPVNVTYTFPVATAMGCGSALAILENVLV